MSEASVRELRNQGGEILDRVEAGERVVVTRDGRPLARLVPVGRPPLSAVQLVERFRKLPPVEVRAIRADIDRGVHQTL